MPNSTGLTSVFPTQLDCFVQKTPFNLTVPLGGQLDTTIEHASHFNMMFDACYNIENFLIDNGLVTYPITSWDTFGNALYGSNLTVSFQSFDSNNLTLANGVYTGTAQVPETFGTNPFSDPNYAISYTLYINPGANVQGQYAGGSNLSALPQYITMITPVSGNVFSINVQALGTNTINGSNNYFSDPLTSQLLYAPLWVEDSYWNVLNDAGIGAAIDYRTGTSYLSFCSGNFNSAQSVYGSAPQYGGDSSFALISPGSNNSITNGYIEFGEYVSNNRSSDAGLNNFGGPMLGVYQFQYPYPSGTNFATLNSFYMFAIGFTSYNKPNYGRFVKVTNFNFPIGQSTTSTYSTPYSSYSPVSLPGFPTATVLDLTGSDYYIGDTASGNYRFRFSISSGATGVTLQLLKSSDGITFTQFASAYDSGIVVPSAAINTRGPYIGLGTMPISDNGNHAYSFTKFLGPVNVKSYDNNGPGLNLPFTLEILHATSTSTVEWFPG